MVDLQQVLKAHTSNRPEYTDHMWGWINYEIRPFRVTRLSIFTEPDYINGSVKIHLDAQNFPEVFTMTFQVGAVLEDSTPIAQQLAVTYGRWLKSFYISPGNHIKLGEN